MDYVKSLAGISIIFFSSIACAVPQLSPEFESILKENHKLKQQGTPDVNRLFSSAKNLADKGDAPAQYLMGMVLMNQNPDVAKQYLQKSSSAGCSGATTMLGILHLKAGDRNQGTPLIVKAAEAGDATAQAALSGIYLRGENVTMSKSDAYKWLKLAERQTFSNGALGAIHEGMKKLEGQFSAEEKIAAEKQFAEAAKKFHVVNYMFCGQANLDTSRSSTVPDYLKM